jgi:DNA double-strand break repair rad50 ATPase
MGLLIKEIHIKNIRSHEDFVFKPHLTGVTSINGVNGSGKSTIVNSFSWCLYGTKFSGQKNKTFIRDGVDAKEKEVSVTSYILVNGEEYKIKRKLLDNKGTCECNVFKKKDDEYIKEAGPAVSHTERYIRELLGIDEKGFLSSIFIQQKQVDQIISASAKERSIIIEKLTGILALTKSIDLAKEEYKTLQKAANLINVEDDSEVIKKINTEKDTINELRNFLNNGKKDYDLLKEQIEIKNQELEEEDKKQEIKNQLTQEYIQTKSNISNYNKVIDENIKMLENNKKNKKVKVLQNEDELKEKQKELNTNIKTETDKYNYVKSVLLSLEEKINKKIILDLDLLIEETEEYIQKLEKDIEDKTTEKLVLKTEITHNNQLIKALKNNEASCPVCGSPIEEEFQSLEEFIEKTKNKKEHFKNIEVEIVSLTSKLNEEKNTLNIYNQNLVFKKEKEESLLLYKEKEKELKKLEKVIKKIDTELSVVNNHLSEINLHKEAISLTKEIEQNVIEYTNRLNEEKEKKKQLETKKNELNALDKKSYKVLKDDTLNENKKFNDLKTDLLQKKQQFMYSKEKYENLILDKNRIDKAKLEYDKLMQEVSVYVKMIKLLTEFKKERILNSVPMITDIASDIFMKFTNNDFLKLELNDKFEVIVQTKDNIIRPVGLLSGGELSTAAIALRIAISLFLNNEDQSLLILDEVLVSMDDERTQNILETIAEITNTQLIFIAHNHLINDISDKIVELE